MEEDIYVTREELMTSCDSRGQGKTTSSGKADFRLEAVTALGVKY